MPVSTDQFKAGLSAFAASVTVVTTLDSDGKPAGLTVTAFSALSKSPPLCLVCVGHEADAYPALNAATSYAVNILGRDQNALAMQFATHGCDKFAGVAYRTGEKMGCPLLTGAIATLECKIVSRFMSGDHDIVVGSIESVLVEAGEPLVWFRGRFNDVVPR
ncbi:MAG TPA: flavin reductase family protein [Polyangiaceae bacterium]|jgi:flavin reductase (DIM6/NTAB) family NADH-FMN oxidoreductase RutF|nr:flavin reductase family protein [Polyangiaceae bacterium]